MKAGRLYYALDRCDRALFFLGALAQLGERLVCNQEVTGSIPVRSIQ